MIGEARLGDSELELIMGALARNESIRTKLKDGGRIHIDRQQPFICVYRYPSNREDRGTDRLLLGGASYALIPESREPFYWWSCLIRRLQAQLKAVFGAAIVLEIWTSADSSAQGSPPRHRFRIVSPTSFAPIRTLEALERAILAAHWPGGMPELEIDYLEHTGPTGMPPLQSSDESPEPGIVSLGLELAPLFRDPEDQRLFPDLLRAMRKELWHVLYQAFFTFAHTRATYRPAHYHELGPRTMTERVAKVDRALALVSDSYDLLLHVTPVNTEAAWSEFKAHDYRGTPEFHYRPLHVDISELKRALYAIPINDIADPALHNLFATKRDEVDRQITMLGDRESRRFALESLQIYGRAAAELKQLAVSLLQRPPETETSSIELLGAEDFADRAREELALYSAQDSEFRPEVILSDTVPGIMVSQGKLIIGRRAIVEARRVLPTLQHEIGTHVLTYYNGLAQPFQQLHAGIAEYEELQEGLAVFAEYLVDGLSVRRMRVLAARVIAVEAVSDGADFTQTFSMLTNEHGFDAKTAYTITMRVHRAGGFSKDIIYLRGLTKLLEYLAAGGDHDELMIGKISFSQIDVIRELRWRGILESPRLRPRYLDQEACRARLQRARDGLSVADLVDV